MGKLVSDGCLYHVCLKVKPEVIRAANTEKQYKILERMANGKVSYIDEIKESAKVDAAQEAVLNDVKCALTAIHTMPKLSELMECDDWELRILLCKVNTEAAVA